VKPTPEGGNQKIKIKVRVNPNGVFNVSSASMIEKVEIEEEVPVEMEVRSQPGRFFYGKNFPLDSGTMNRQYLY
jgi:Hsp70 protein